MLFMDDLSTGMFSSLFPFYSETLMCLVLPYRFFSTPSYFRDSIFHILNRDSFKCSANQSNLVSGSSPEVGPDNTFPSFLHTCHLSQLGVNTIYLLCFEIYFHWGFSNKNWVHCSIKPLCTNVRKRSFLIILLQFLFPHWNYYSGRIVKDKVQTHIYEEVIVGSSLNKCTLLSLCLLIMSYTSWERI
jgi:hypothetical protein